MTDAPSLSPLTDAPSLSPLAAALSLTARRYAFERQRPVTGSAFASFFRRDVAALAREVTDQRSECLLVRASTGAPGWASIPWLACFALHVTRSMRHGLYVVLFIDPVGERIVLSLQHGAANALTRHGATEGRRMLREAAAATQRALAGRDHGFSEAPITLNSAAALPLGYEAGCALSRVWQADAPDLDGLEDALSRMLDLYRDLVGGG